MREAGMKSKELYLHLAEACERTAGITDLPDKRAGMLASAAVWRRLAAASKPSGEAGSEAQRDKLAVPEHLESGSFLAALPGSKN